MKGTIFAAGISLATLTPLTAQQKPNVVFIVTDDLGYGDLSCYGQEKFQTPNIDRLALDGIRFTHSYSGTTVSAPSRASLMTGLHTGHTPIRGNKEVKPEGQFPLPEGTVTLFHLFKKAGYATGAFGKWGLGQPGSEGDPNRQGVDEFYGYNCQLLAHNYYPDHLWHNQTKIVFPENENGQFGAYSQDLIQAKTLEFIDNHGKDPFFLFVPIVLPHAELVVPEDSIIRNLRGKFDEKPYKGTDSGPAFRKGGYMSQEYPRATHAAMVKRIDAYVGQIIGKLKEKGVYDNTLIIFTSDNGPHREGGADPDFFNSNGVYRGYKRDLYEGGIRVPTIISWHGKIASGKESNFTFAFWDYMPTFAELLKVGSPKDSDGISILPTLLDKGKQKKHDYFYFEFQELGGRQAVIQGDWKLLHLDIRNGGKYELYNLASDPSENHNLIDLYPRKATTLKEIMKKARTDDPNWPLF
ncbi:arylsulfatase [Proteiniphilum sp.]|uniref:arylsulfatase n=1 Tax=Proteiniphilum sp. TaxID=1926877 RepID=UPI002B1F38DA|nr:arylsulfatase [Proteiniphilum sp.]MEA4915984.1 arylsulfatase [Proteiniphilum sp.]